MTTFERLNTITENRGAGYLVLLDPDKQSIEDLVDLAKQCEDADVDGLLVGGSLLFSNHFDAVIKNLKEAVSIPVVLFPGSSQQLSKHADALLFMTLLSGRNPQYLIEEQVRAAPIVRALDLETISMAYMLIESGITTAAEFMSNTRPIPRHKPEITVAHALAAHYMGMKMIYLEAGSGAKESVPEKMIGAVSQYVHLPLIVGGGIKTPEDAQKKVAAGASFIVTGNVLEKAENHHLIESFAKAIHQK